MSNEDLATQLMCEYDKILYHVQKFMIDKELRGIKETPGELALRFRNRDEMPKTLIWGFAPLKCHTVPSIIPKATPIPYSR